MVQRVLRARVEAEGEVTGAIERGLVAFIGAAEGDTDADLAYPLEEEGQLLGALVAGLPRSAISLATLERLELRAALAAAELGRRIGASFNVPHGVTSCITLPHVMRYKAATEARRLAPIAHALRLVPADAPYYEAVLAAADAVAGLIGALGLPSRLSEVNVPADALDEIARSVVGDTPEAAAIAELLRRAY